MKRLITLTCIMALLIAIVPVVPAAEKTEVDTPKAEPDRPVIQLALLLDTSGSMSGLIDQARARLWSIVNEFIDAHHDGVRPTLQVALYQYGNSGLKPDTLWVQRISPFTDDLDRISTELFKLGTNGGTELCGEVIHRATTELTWTDSKTALKVIVIAGNEGFNQMHGSSTDYKTACKAAIAKGIMVNTIFCGPADEGVRTGWKDGAVMADGRYASIDQNRTVADIETPYDKKIVELGNDLNTTYVPYGNAGKQRAAEQKVNDRAAAKMSVSSSVQRQVTKSNAYYNSGSWDLVDAVTRGDVKLEDVKKEDLPETMQKMDMDQRKTYVQENHRRRQDIQTKINMLNAKRNEYVEKKRAEADRADGKQRLDEAVVKQLREQAEKKNFRFEK